jgi:hypothetical protein
MASILTVFKIEKPVDELGNAIEPRVEFAPGLFRWGSCFILHPTNFVHWEARSTALPFKAKFTPRFPGAANLIKSSIPVN